ncbi:hypothetical protein EV421DRAFT_1740696 [Armillaria borealis]|uniref:Uncharacterized protein n=1 Tax=Armillaria borealis TaxID=47425 RepID=A0AA39J240_9AGAR|nr:hypothetical protein EV421DRAFT_1740696 [Armillaria borealis]
MLVSGCVIQARLARESNSQLPSLVSMLLVQLRLGNMQEMECRMMSTIALTAIHSIIRDQPPQSTEQIRAHLWLGLRSHTESLLSNLSQTGFSPDLSSFILALGELLDLLLVQSQVVVKDMVHSPLFKVLVSTWLKMWVCGLDIPVSVFGRMIKRVATEYESALHKLTDLLSETTSCTVAASFARVAIIMHDSSISLSTLQMGYDFVTMTLACGPAIFRQLLLDQDGLEWCTAGFLRHYDVFICGISDAEFKQFGTHLALSLHFVRLSFRHGPAAIIRAMERGFLTTLFKLLAIFRSPHTSGEVLETEFVDTLTVIQANLYDRRITNRVLEDWRWLEDRDTSAWWPIDSLAVTKAWIELLSAVVCIS